MIFITSDTHFAHANICRGVSKWTDKSGTRDFNSIDEMNNAIIDNINSMVAPTDSLYHLGDFCFGDKSLTPYWRSKINCRNIYLIYGNHDHGIDKYRNEFVWIKDYFTLRHSNKHVVLFHYPIASWEGRHHGALHAFGHCHGSFNQPNGRSMDVGVDTNNFRPYSIEKFIELCEQKPIFDNDHHKSLV